jgi:UDP-N-acetylbacillosamine N-acetyltransferase
MILSGKNKRVNVIGAGGHARSVIALLHRCEYGVDGVYDAAWKEGSEERIAGVLVRGAEPTEDRQIVLAIGDNRRRSEFAEQYGTRLLLQSVIDPTAIMTGDVAIGNHNLIMARVAMNQDVKVGHNNIINTGAIIEHESEIGNHNHISVGAVLCGRVKVGDYCFIGAGSVIADKISICSNVIIGAGGVVIRNITEPGTYVGNPVRKIK